MSADLMGWLLLALSSGGLLWGLRTVLRRRRFERQLRRWKSIGFVGEFTADGPRFLGEIEGLRVRVEPLGDEVSIRVEREDLGGDFTVVLDQTGGEGVRWTGDPGFDAMAWIETRQPIEALAALDGQRRVMLRTLADYGQVRLTRGRLEVLVPHWQDLPALMEKVQVTLGLARMIGGAPRAEAALPALLERLKTAPTYEQVAIAHLLVEQAKASPEVRSALNTLKHAADPQVRLGVVRLVGEPIDWQVLAADPQVPTEVRVEAFLEAGVDGLLSDQPPADPAALACLAKALVEPPHRRRALQAALELQWAELIGLVERLPVDPERDDVLSRLKSRRRDRTGQLALASGDAGGLGVVEEAGGLALKGKS